MAAKKKRVRAAALCVILLLSTAAPALGADGDETFYPGASALRVTLGETEQGALYLLTVSSGKEAFYADRKTGGGALRFSVSFPLPGVQTEYLLEIGSSAAGFGKTVIPFWPERQCEPGTARRHPVALRMV